MTERSDNYFWLGSNPNRFGTSSACISRGRLDGIYWLYLSLPLLFLVSVPWCIIILIDIRIRVRGFPFRTAAVYMTPIKGRNPFQTFRLNYTQSLLFCIKVNNTTLNVYKVWDKRKSLWKLNIYYFWLLAHGITSTKM